MCSHQPFTGKVSLGMQFDWVCSLTCETLQSLAFLVRKVSIWCTIYSMRNISHSWTLQRGGRQGPETMCIKTVWGLLHTQVTKGDRRLCLGHSQNQNHSPWFLPIPFSQRLTSSLCGSISNVLAPLSTVCSEVKGPFFSCFPSLNLRMNSFHL